MSLEKLSTELDIHIVQYPDRTDVSSFSQTSKYYRSICEPILYEAVTFWSDEHNRVKRLLLTLLARSELRRLIKHVDLKYRDGHAKNIPQQQLSILIAADPTGE
jgi:hypothetical protein